MGERWPRRLVAATPETFRSLYKRRLHLLTTPEETFYGNANKCDIGIV